jgi:hypothetical protein
MDFWQVFGSFCWIFGYAHRRFLAGFWLRYLATGN